MLTSLEGLSWSDRTDIFLQSKLGLGIDMLCAVVEHNISM